MKSPNNPLPAPLFVCRPHIGFLNVCFAFIFVIGLVSNFSAHTPEGLSEGERNWTIDGNIYKASFMMYRDELVYLETSTNDILKVPLARFAELDQIILEHKIAAIYRINNKRSISPAMEEENMLLVTVAYCALFVCLTVLLVGFLFFRPNSIFKIFTLVLFSVTSTAIIAFKSPSKILMQSSTSPNKIDSAFRLFKSAISTYWNQQYFYVESNGIPLTHTMMVGISDHGWQQQVPIPQCYTGSNAWPIPLNPTVSATPVPVNNQHFIKGAIAIAANGVPIFNVYTNAGVDSYADGQLDAFGGHCGRADDYHYHIAPLHLYATNPATLPIAYALDGYAVYGSKEPDGSNMTGLDPNHGHFGTDGVYHYHGTATAPYMIGNMVGKVTEDADNQLIPQAQTTPIRPALTPLAGASITACYSLANNAYQLIYKLNSQTYTVSYNWTPTGVYTYSFIANSGTSTETYTGFTPCLIKTDMNQNDITIGEGILYPNPAQTFIRIIETSPIYNEVTKALLYDMQGRMVMSAFPSDGTINIEGLTKGNYIVYLISPYRVYKTRVNVEN